MNLSASAITAESVYVGPTPDREARSVAEIEARGNVVVRSDDRTLQLDLDSPEDLQKACKLIHQLHRNIFFEKITRTISKSGNSHIYIELAKPMERIERIAWQACLGSDRVREALNLLWVLSGYEEECFLEELPGAKHEDITDHLIVFGNLDFKSLSDPRDGGLF